MIRYGAVKNTFVLKDFSTDQVIQEFRSAQKLFEFLGGRVYASDVECKYYGTFVKVLGDHDWRLSGEMELTSQNGKKKTFKLLLKKELR